MTTPSRFPHRFTFVRQPYDGLWILRGRYRHFWPNGDACTVDLGAGETRLQAVVHFAAKLNAPDLTAEVERLEAELTSAVVRNGTIARDKQQEIDRLTAEIERLTAERDRLRSDLAHDEGELERLAAELAKVNALLDYWHSAAAPDPEAPPIPCVEVEPTDGRRTWRAMGEDVRTLGDEWEALTNTQAPFHWRINQTQRGRSYLIRRTTPPAPRTERVKWWEAKGRLRPDGAEFVYVGEGEEYAFASVKHRDEYAYDDGTIETHADSDGTVEVLTEDGPR